MHFSSPARPGPALDFSTGAHSEQIGGLTGKKMDDSTRQ
jgi:hypothetical protein